MLCFASQIIILIPSGMEDTDDYVRNLYFQPFRSALFRRGSTMSFCLNLTFCPEHSSIY